MSRPSQRSTLEAALQQRDRRAEVVPRRVLRRVIKQHHELKGVGLQVPHAMSFVLSRDELLSAVEPAELERPAETLSERVVLIADPERALSPDELLVYGWRELFHARVHMALDALLESGALDLARVRARIDAVGQAEFDEIRSVLHQEDRLLPPGQDIDTWTEFCALYLELRWFARQDLDRFFPTLLDQEAVDAAIATDVDAEALWRDTRPVGAPDPSPILLSTLCCGAGANPAALPDGVLFPPEGEAEAPASVNAPLKRPRSERAMALATRLCHATGGSEPSTWAEQLEPLCRAESLDPRGRAARLLAELEKAATSSERVPDEVDTLGWMMTLGKRPLHRALPYERERRILGHLRSADSRSGSVELEAPEREALGRALRGAVAGIERDLRRRLRPDIARVLRQVGFSAHGAVERAAERRLHEELLDRAVERGFLTFGDLRDAVSRGGIRLPDLGGLSELVKGDPLLRADAELTGPLDGIYRRGDVYLRGLQKLSSLAFGTRIGRPLVRYVGLPFGGSFVILEALQHMVVPAASALGHAPPRIASLTAILVTGVFLGLVIHVPTVRRGLWRAGEGLWGLISFALIGLPGRLIRLPAVRRLLESHAFDRFSRLVIRPAMVALPVFVIGPLFGFEWTTTAILAAAVFLPSAAIMNTRLGLRVEEYVADGLIRAWRSTRHRLAPGLYRLLVDVFARMLDLVERGLFAVDELLRHRPGDRRAALVLRAICSPVWAVITWVIRLYITLLVEPQVNPIKHFPVVTVAHKIMLPFSLTLTQLLMVPLSPLGSFASATIAGMTIFLLPGVFGFLVWELKENWKLYESNRQPDVSTAMVGHHSETMLGFMRPGFHSGTLPKAWARFRRARPELMDSALRKHRQTLEEVEEAVRHFLERELVYVLDECEAFWPELRIGRVVLGSNRVAVEIHAEIISHPLRIVFEEQSGWLLAGIAQSGWSAMLEPALRRDLRAALIGLYKRAGVDMVREQLEDELRGVTPDESHPRYDIADEGLLVWPGEDYSRELVFDLTVEEGPITGVDRASTGEAFEGSAQSLDDSRVFLSRHPVARQEWAQVWRQDAEAERAALLTGLRFLPRPGHLRA